MNIAATPARTRTTGRSIAAVLAGFLVVVILSTATDFLMHSLGIFPAVGTRMSDRLFVLATLYRTLFTILGGYITARLAPARPIRHGIILGILGTIVGTIGAVFTWNLNLGPHWYSLALVVLAIPSCWVGARLHRPT